MIIPEKTQKGNTLHNILNIHISRHIRHRSAIASRKTEQHVTKKAVLKLNNKNQQTLRHHTQRKVDTTASHTPTPHYIKPPLIQFYYALLIMNHAEVYNKYY
jgi:hypothetical protein